MVPKGYYTAFRSKKETGSEVVSPATQSVVTQNREQVCRLLVSAVRKVE